MSTSAVSLNPWYVTGFNDAESSFQIYIAKRSVNKLGWRELELDFISIYISDISIYLLIQLYFCGIGSIVLKEKLNKALLHLMLTN
jgi:hypothetical protein